MVCQAEPENTLSTDDTWAAGEGWGVVPIASEGDFHTSATMMDSNLPRKVIVNSDI